jgi:hypothetical protein
LHLLQNLLRLSIITGSPWNTSGMQRVLGSKCNKTTFAETKKHQNCPNMHWWQKRRSLRSFLSQIPVRVEWNYNKNLRIICAPNLSGWKQLALFSPQKME